MVKIEKGEILNPEPNCLKRHVLHNKHKRFYSITNKCKQSIQNFNSPDDEAYTTSCLNNFQFNEGSIDDNGFLFCPFCGKIIKQSNN